MFEGPKEDKELGLHKAWIATFVAVAAILVLVCFYALNRGQTKVSAQTQVPSAAQAASADPVKDLRIERATMQKDNLGTTTLWLVSFTNMSRTFAYSDITYEAQYIGADNKVIVVSKGTIPIRIEPNGQKTSEIRDPAYPAGVAWYRFKVTGAKATAE